MEERDTSEYNNTAEPLQHYTLIYHLPPDHVKLNNLAIHQVSCGYVQFILRCILNAVLIDLFALPIVEEPVCMM